MKLATCCSKRFPYASAKFQKRTPSFMLKEYRAWLILDLAT
jgi:hypothetical protein